MRNNNFEDIIKKYKNLEKKNIEDKAELKVINKRLKEEFNCDSIEELQEKLNDMKEEKEHDEKKKNKLMEKLENITDWNEIEMEEE